MTFFHWRGGGRSDPSIRISHEHNISDGLVCSMGICSAARDYTNFLVLIPAMTGDAHVDHWIRGFHPWDINVIGIANRSYRRHGSRMTRSSQQQCSAIMFISQRGSYT